MGLLHQRPPAAAKSDVVESDVVDSKGWIATTRFCPPTSCCKRAAPSAGSTSRRSLSARAAAEKRDPRALRLQARGVITHGDRVLKRWRRRANGAPPAVPASAPAGNEACARASARRRARGCGSRREMHLSSDAAAAWKLPCLHSVSASSQCGTLDRVIAAAGGRSGRAGLWGTAMRCEWTGSNGTDGLPPASMTVCTTPCGVHDFFACSAAAFLRAALHSALCAGQCFT